MGGGHHLGHSGDGVTLPWLPSLTLQLLDERPGHAGAAGVEDHVSLVGGGMEMGVGDLLGGRTTAQVGGGGVGTTFSLGGLG